MDQGKAECAGLILGVQQGYTAACATLTEGPPPRCCKPRPRHVRLDQGESTRVIRLSDGEECTAASAAPPGAPPRPGRGTRPLRAASGPSSTGPRSRTSSPGVRPSQGLGSPGCRPAACGTARVRAAPRSPGRSASPAAHPGARSAARECSGATARHECGGVSCRRRTPEKRWRCWLHADIQFTSPFICTAQPDFIARHLLYALASTAHVLAYCRHLKWLGRSRGMRLIHSLASVLAYPRGRRADA